MPLPTAPIRRLALGLPLLLALAATAQTAPPQRDAATLAREEAAIKAARIGQRAERDFVGANTGLMDQLASALGQPDRVLLIDCRDLSYRPVPTPAGTTILIADTAVRRQLASSAYNERRAQCEAAAAAMGVPALRDATLEMLGRVEVPDVVRRRAQHVVHRRPGRHDHQLRGARERGPLAVASAGADAER